MKREKFNLLEELEKKEAKLNLINDIDNLLPEESISIKVDSYESLFNPFDPSPAAARKLNRDLEDYIMEQTENMKNGTKLTVNIYVSNIQEKDVTVIKAAFENHFKLKAKAQLNENKKESRKWRVNLGIGIMCMAVCLLASHILGLPQFADIPLNNAIAESLGILGWVAIWEPAEFFLFGRRKNTDSLQDCMRLHKAKVNVFNADEEAATFNETEVKN